MTKLWALLFGCTHKHTGFPISVRKGKRCETYVCCLDCGKELPYLWEELGKIA